MQWYRRTPLVLTAAGVLCLSIAAAALTTSDARWWLSCFSQLGAMNDASSVIFNAGLVLTGALIAVSAFPVSTGFRRARAAGFRAHRSVGALVPLLVGMLGLSLILIGLLPLSFNTYAHERAANGALASSAGLLLMHRLSLRGLSLALDRIADGSVAVLIIGMVGMIAGMLTLTVFEALAFGAIITWLHTFEMRVRRLRLAARPRFIVNSQQLIRVPRLGDTDFGVSVMHTAGVADRYLGIRSTH